MNQLILLLPEIYVTLLAFVVLLGEAFFPKYRRLWIGVSLVGLLPVVLHMMLFFINEVAPFAAGRGVSPVNAEGLWIEYAPVLGMVLVDSQAMFFKLALVLASMVVLGFSWDYREFDDLQAGTYSSLLLLGTLGMMLLVGSIDFLMAILSLELLGISSFVLTGFVLKRSSSTEGAIKFFLVGTLSTALFLFGMSYYYGFFGTTHISPLLNYPASGQVPHLAMILFLVFLLAGLGFKLAMVPFHMWAPDAYEGASTPITAFLSVAPKAAAIGFLLRFLSDHSAFYLTPVLAVLAALTMTVGNLGALHQTNVKRLLAYSSIAQVGYILVAFVAGGSLGQEAAIFYTVVYLFMNLGIFSVFILVSNEAKSATSSA